jgi:hypothetical protein
VQNVQLLNKKLELENAELKAQLRSAEVLFNTVGNGLNPDAGQYSPIVRVLI